MLTPSIEGNMSNTFTDQLIDESKIASAVDYLCSGNLVAFPTETVYGLGADASNEKALQKLYAVKGRPAAHPVIVHLFSAEQMQDWAVELSDYAKRLAQHFWPGPLTLIVKKSAHVSPLVTGGQPTIGLRVPGHPIALALLKAFAGGIAAPSANTYGRVSSTCAQHVREEFADQVSLIIDGGSCPVGIESTIVDTTALIPRILRPGIISEKEILECLGLDGLPIHDHIAKADEGYIRVPGSDKTHYAPRTPMLLLNKNLIESTLDRAQSGVSFAILVLSKLDLDGNTKAKTLVRKTIQASQDPKLYAHDLYSNLRHLDSSKATTILVESVPQSGEWRAVSDRLNRAASRS